jgi:AAA domain-containing protein
LPWRPPLSNIDWDHVTCFSSAISRPVKWIVEEIVPANTVTLLSSVSGAGKSVLAINLAICVLTGQRWLGVETSQMGVAYWDQDNPDGELTENRIVAVARGLGLHPGALPQGIVFRSQGPIVSIPEEVLRLRDELLRRRIGLLIIDTLASINPWDEQSVTFSRVITHGLFPIVEAGITPLVLHHIGKPAIDAKGQKHQRNGIEAARGHSSLAASVGAAYNLMRDGNERYIECVKPRYGHQPDIHIDYDEDGAMGLPDWKITIGTPRVNLSRSNLTQMILTRGWGSLSSREIVRNVGLAGFFASQSTAARALSESK